MVHILTIVCCAPTSAIREAAFPLDEGLDAQGLRAAQALAPSIRRVDAAWTGPSRRARETAAALGLVATTEPRIDDLGGGEWAGRRFADVAALDPAALAAWLEEGAAAPGGESVADLVARVEGWLRSLGAAAGRSVAVSHPAVARAAVVVALRAPIAAFWRVEAGPLARVRLRGGGARWTLLSIVP